MRVPFGLVAVLALATLSSPTAAPAIHLSSDLKQCIKIESIRAETAESDQSVIFHANGARAYRNLLPRPCDDLHGINNLSHLKLFPSGEELCQGDKISVVDHDIVATIVGKDRGETAETCTLGPFEAISEMSVSELLRR